MVLDLSGLDSKDALLAAMESLRQRLHETVGDAEPLETLAERLQAAEEISHQLDRLIVRYMQLIDP